MDVKRIREWKKRSKPMNELSLTTHGKEIKRLVDDCIVEWIYDRREKNLSVLLAHHEKSKGHLR